METISGIGYVVWNDSREMFLGRMGAWSPDVRLAQVYSEPRSARMAITRLGESTLTYPVPVSITVVRKHLESGKADEQRRIASLEAEANGKDKPKEVKIKRTAA